MFTRDLIQQLKQSLLKPQKKKKEKKDKKKKKEVKNNVFKTGFCENLVWR